MLFDADTLKDMQTTLSYTENLVRYEFEGIPKEKKAKIKEIMEHPHRTYVDGDTLMIHSLSALLENSRGDIKADIPFERIKTIDIIGDASKGFYNAVYLEKTIRFLFPNVTRFVSSSAYYHFDAFKNALNQRMLEETNRFETLWFGFSYGGDIYTLEYVGDNGLDVYCASHPFANTSFKPLALSLANYESPRIEARYIKHLSIHGELISSLSSFRQGLYESGLESLMNECENLEEIVVADDCPIKSEIIHLAEDRGIRVVES